MTKKMRGGAAGARDELVLRTIDDRTKGDHFGQRLHSRAAASRYSQSSLLWIGLAIETLQADWNFTSCTIV